MRKQTVLSVVAILAVLAGGAFVWYSSTSNSTGADKGDKLLPEPKLAQQPPVPDKSGSPQTAANSKTPEVKKYLEGLSPDEAVRTIEAMPPGADMKAACAEFGSRMAVEDPAKFFAWHAQLKDPEAANSAMVAFGSTLAAKNPDAFWALVKSEKPGPNMARLADVFNAAVASTDPARALEIASRMSTEESPLAAEFRKGAIRGAANSTTPEAAVDAFLATPIEQNVTTSEAGALIKAILGKDFGQSFDTLMRLPEGEYRATVASEYIQDMAAKDPETAGELVNRMAPGQTRDYAVGRMLNALMDTNTDAAIVWAGAATDETTRARLIGDLRKHFERSNPAALEALNVKYPPAAGLGNSSK